MSLIIATPNNLNQRAIDASYYGHTFFVKWSVKDSTIQDLPFPVEACFIMLAGSLAQAVNYEMGRLMKGQGGRFHVELEAYQLDADEIAACEREGADMIDIRTDEEVKLAQDGADDVAAHEDGLIDQSEGN
jgi:hypothetical protein